MNTLWLDRETFCELDLKAVGTYQYADHAHDLLLAYAIDDEPAKVWDCLYEPCPDELWVAMESAPEVWAHNAQFDKAAHNGPAQRSLPRIALHRWRCSMALALSHALPASLGDLCDVLKVDEDKAKHKDGKRLVELFTRPQPANRKIRIATRKTHPEEWKRFKAYAVNDVEAMREVVRRIPKWNWNDGAIAEWHCDQRINERGFAVDVELARAGAAAAVTEKERIGLRFRELTEGSVDRPSLRQQFLTYLNSRFGLSLDNTRSDTFGVEVKREDLDPVCKELMRLAIASNKTSTAKYAALLPAIQDDGRFRGGLQFAGASRTRRWAGRLFQPQNLPSRGLPDAEVIESYIDCLKSVGADVELYFDNIMLLGAAALRGLVIAPEGCKMEVADLSNIEGRMLAWVSGEDWKLQAFREYDAGVGPDLYKVTASIITGIPAMEVPKSLRNSIGKVADLASGYMGGVPGYQNFARAYNVKLADYWDALQQNVSAELVQKAKANFTRWGREQSESLEISELEWVSSETCKLAWRARHPATVRFWYALQDAAKSAIRNWGQTCTVNRYIKVKGVDHKGQRWLVVQLPSGRYLTYFDPRLVDDMITYMGEAAEEGKTTRQWVRVWTHGGKMTGNVCQTLARDILAPALQIAEDKGYTPILTVHDEVLTEVPDSPEFDSDGLAAILATNPDWSAGLPLAAAAFETHRYKKD
jgi:DNA polymerase